MKKKTQKGTVKYIRERERIKIREEERKYEKKKADAKERKAQKLKQLLKKKVKATSAGKKLNKFLVGKRMVVRIGG